MKTWVVVGKTRVAEKKTWSCVVFTRVVGSETGVVGGENQGWNGRNEGQGK